MPDTDSHGGWNTATGRVRVRDRVREKVDIQR